MKKWLLLVVVVVYLLLGWLADEQKMMAVLDSADRRFYIQYHFLYDKITFFNNQSNVDYTSLFMNYDKIFIVSTALVWLVAMFIRYKSKKN